MKSAPLDLSKSDTLTIKGNISTAVRIDAVDSQGDYPIRGQVKLPWNGEWVDMRWAKDGKGFCCVRPSPYWGAGRNFWMLISRPTALRPT